VSFYVKPPALGLDPCSGPGGWSYWIRHVGGYELLQCDVEGRERVGVVCDLRHPPFRSGCFDFVLADPPFPFYRGKRYGGLRSVEEYSDILAGIGRLCARCLRPGGYLFLKTSDFWREGEMFPGIHLVHEALKGVLSCVDVVVAHIKPFRYLPGRFKRSVRIHNYLVVYRKVHDPNI